MYELLNEWSYYGRYSGTEVNGQQYEKYEYSGWLKPTVENGVLIDIGEDKLWQYGTCLYGNDYVLVGTYVLPFVRRGGAWDGSTNTGVFAFRANDGSPYYYARFSSGGCGIA